MPDLAIWDVPNADSSLTGGSEVRISPGEGWKHHAGINAEFKKKCGEIGRPITALLKDLRSSGLFDDTLFVWGGGDRRVRVQGRRGPGRRPRPARDRPPPARPRSREADGLVQRPRGRCDPGLMRLGSTIRASSESSDWCSGCIRSGNDGPSGWRLSWPTISRTPAGGAGAGDGSPLGRSAARLFHCPSSLLPSFSPKPFAEPGGHSVCGAGRACASGGPCGSEA